MCCYAQKPRCAWSSQEILQVFRIDGSSFFEPILERQVSIRLRLWDRLSRDRLLGRPGMREGKDKPSLIIHCDWESVMLCDGMSPALTSHTILSNSMGSYSDTITAGMAMKNDWNFFGLFKI